MKYKVVTDNASKLLRHLSESKKQFFTFHDAEQFMRDASLPYVKKLLQNLVERELIMRLKKGLYVIIPYDIPAKEYFPDHRVVASHLAGDAKQYIGYYSALQLHSLTTQPGYTTQIVIDTFIRPTVQEIHGVKFQFIHHDSESFFGIKKMWPDSYNWVYCSDLEKTIIDCLYKPDYAQGITEVAKALYKAKEKLKYDKLLEYIKQFDKQVVVKRLGFLLDLYKIENPITRELLKMKTASYAVLDPLHPRRGKTQGRWSVQINFDLETIKQAPFS